MSEGQPDFMNTKEEDLPPGKWGVESRRVAGGKFFEATDEGKEKFGILGTYIVPTITGKSTSYTLNTDGSLGGVNLTTIGGGFIEREQHWDNSRYELEDGEDGTTTLVVSTLTLDLRSDLPE